MCDVADVDASFPAIRSTIAKPRYPETEIEAMMRAGTAARHLADHSPDP
jgi:hypothetical protein